MVKKSPYQGQRAIGGGIHTLEDHNNPPVPQEPARELVARSMLVLCEPAIAGHRCPPQLDSLR